MSSSRPENSALKRSSESAIALIQRLTSDLNVRGTHCEESRSSTRTSKSTPVPNAFLTDGISAEPDAETANLSFRMRTTREANGTAAFSGLRAIRLALSELITDPSGGGGDGNQQATVRSSFGQLYAHVCAITRSSRWHTDEQLAALCASSQVSAVLVLLVSERNTGPRSWKWVVYQPTQATSDRPVVALVRHHDDHQYAILTRRQHLDEATAIEIDADVPIEEVHLKAEQTANASTIVIRSLADLVNQLRAFVPEARTVDIEQHSCLYSLPRLMHTSGIAYLSRAMCSPLPALVSVPTALVDACLQSLAVRVCELEESTSEEETDSSDAFSDYCAVELLLVLALQNYASSSPSSRSASALNCLPFTFTQAHQSLNRFVELVSVALALCANVLQLPPNTSSQFQSIQQHRETIFQGVRALWRLLSDFYARFFLAKVVSSSTSVLPADRKILLLILEFEADFECAYRTIRSSKWPNRKANLQSKAIETALSKCIDQLDVLYRLLKCSPSSPLFARPSSSLQQPPSKAAPSGQRESKSSTSTRDPRRTPDASWLTALLSLAGPDCNRSLAASVRWVELFRTRRGLRSPSGSTRATSVHCALSTVLTHALQVDVHANLSHCLCVPLSPSSENVSAKPLTPKIRTTKRADCGTKRSDGRQLDWNVFKVKETRVRFEDLVNIDPRAFGSPKKQPSNWRTEYQHLISRGGPKAADMTPFKRLAPLPPLQKSSIAIRAAAQMHKQQPSHPRAEWREVRLTEIQKGYTGRSTVNMWPSRYKSTLSLQLTAANREEPTARRIVSVRRAYSLSNLRVAQSTAASDSPFASAPDSFRPAAGTRKVRDTNSIRIDDGPLPILLKLSYRPAPRTTRLAPSNSPSLYRNAKKRRAEAPGLSIASSAAPIGPLGKYGGWRIKLEQRIPKRILMRNEQLPEIPAARKLLEIMDSPNTRPHETN